MASIIQWRRDTAADWTSNNPILAQGEAGLETDTNKLKIGDGATAWTSLAYFGGVDAATTARLDLLENLIAINTLRDSVDAGWTVLDMIDGIADEYEDETGIDTGTSTATYNASGDYYVNAASGTYYLLQSETTNGDTSFPDAFAAYTTTATNSAQHSTAQAKFGSSSIDLTSTKYLSITNDSYFDFGTNDFTIELFARFDSVSGVQVLFNNGGGASSGYVFYLSGANLILATYPGPSNFVSNAHGMSANTWYHIALTRSGDDFKMFIDGTQIGTTVTDTRTMPAASGAEQIGIQGGVNQFSGYMEEIRIENGTAQYTSNFTAPTTPFSVTPQNVIVQSNSNTASTQPDNARLVVLHEPIDSVTINTDVKAYVSRDGGTTFTEATLTNDAAFNSTVNVLTTGDIDISAQPAGTNMEYKLETLNNKEQRFHGTWLQWR